jgi:hypothetical protein
MKNKLSDNWKESWNPEDWQGRSKNQIIGGYKIMFICLIAIVVVSLLYAI